MLTIHVGGGEVFDEDRGEFIKLAGTPLRLEHSLVSLSKWEGIFEKPFLGKEAHTSAENIEYIKAMCLAEEVPEDIFLQLSPQNFKDVDDYINRKMTATWFREGPNAKPSREVITAELIYYWMTAFSIPFECERWHLNRLFTLIRICNVKQSNEQPNKRTSGEIAAERRAMNEKRRAELKTKG